MAETRQAYPLWMKMWGTVSAESVLTSHSLLKEGHLMQPGGCIVHAQQVSCMDRHSIHCSRGLGMQQLVDQGLGEARGQGRASFYHLQPCEHAVRDCREDLGRLCRHSSQKSQLHCLRTACDSRPG